MIWAQIRHLETPPAGPKCQYYQGRVQKVASPAGTDVQNTALALR